MKARLERMAIQELHREQIGGESVYFAPASSTFRVGEMTIRVGLVEPAMKLLRLLQYPEAGGLDNLLHTFSSQIAATTELVRSMEGVFVRADGIIGMRI